MAAPNLKNPTTVTGKTKSYAATTVVTSFLENPAASNKVLKINSVYCANINGINAVDVELYFNDGTTNYALAFQISIPARATQVLLTRDAYIYIEEGGSLRAKGSSTGGLNLTVGYEEIG